MLCAIRSTYFHLRVPESTDSLVRPVAGSSLAFVVLENGGEEKKERDGRVDDALVGDVDVSQLLVHRLVQRDHQHHVDVGRQPKQT